MKRKQRISQGVLHAVFIVLCLAMFLPILIMISSSLTEDTFLTKNGYQVLPGQFSTLAYTYLLGNASSIFRSYGISLLVTVVGTVGSLLVVSMFAYPLSLPNPPGGKLVMFLLVFAMLFSGGLVPSYILWTQYLNVRNSILAYILPSMFMSPFNVILVRNYYANAVPHELVEAAYIDGATEMQTLFRVMLPLAKPILATVGIMSALGYWNDWFNGMIYITDTNLQSIQVYLNQVQRNIQFLASSPMAKELPSFTTFPQTSARMAIAVVTMLPILCVYPFIQKLFIRGIAAGAVKG